jgi:hypothetical protein
MAYAWERGGRLVVASSVPSFGPFHSRGPLSGIAAKSRAKAMAACLTYFARSFPKTGLHFSGSCHGIKTLFFAD